jgi:hypothetical protein
VLTPLKQKQTDFITVDTTAGGHIEAANNPWIYLRFPQTGAENVESDDETDLVFLRMEWALSLKRDILRLNAGNSGISCVDSTNWLEYWSYTVVLF